MHWVVCLGYYLDCMIVNINVPLLNEESLNVTTLRYWCLRFFLAWNPLFIFRYIDAATPTFQVLLNKYFLKFRLALLCFYLLIVLRALVRLVTFNNFLVFNFPFFNSEQYFSFPKYSFLISDVIIHYQLNAFKIPKMV